ncbi:MAG: cbb3-type cytochrome c oxidase subunit I [Polyangiaceae bacterium]
MTPADIEAAQHLQHIHETPKSFVKRYVFSIDHKYIAKQFLWAGLLFLFFGGMLAMLIRWQWAYPGEAVPVVGQWLFPDTQGAITPPVYNTIFTTHGLIMIFFAITPIMIGCFGNFCIPLMIGARDMAFPWLNLLSFWIFVISQVLVLASFGVELGSAAAGWTTYPPLSSQVGTPGLGQSLMVLALFVTGVSTIMGAINYITTVIRFRAPGMTWFRMPGTVWGLWLTSILNALFVPVLGSAGLMLLFDRHFGTQFFLTGAAGGTGDPILFQHLFWIFGHPEVYILILPIWGFVIDFMSFFARKPAYWFRGSIYAMITVTVLSAVVYGHHMFVTGMSPLLGQAFMLLTLVISVPAEILFLNWLHTIWKGSIRLTVPMLFGLGTIFVFGLGGLTGIYLGTISTDLYLHDTMFVVGHFHLTMAAAAFLGSFGALYLWFPKMYGRLMNEFLGKVHFWFSAVGLTLVFGFQMLAGYAGQQRRLYDPFQYSYLEGLQDLNRFTTYCAFALAIGQLAFVYNFFYSLFAGKRASQNPWELGTIEWTNCASPPVHHNFDRIPVVYRGPHEYNHPEVLEKLGRDWIGQTEEFDPAADAVTSDEVAATA